MCGAGEGHDLIFLIVDSGNILSRGRPVCNPKNVTDINATNQLMTSKQKEQQRHGHGWVLMLEATGTLREHLKTLYFSR